MLNLRSQDLQKKNLIRGLLILQVISFIFLAIFFFSNYRLQEKVRELDKKLDMHIKKQGEDAPAINKQFTVFPFTFTPIPFYFTPDSIN